MRQFVRLLLVLFTFSTARAEAPAASERVLRVAAASDLQFALEELVAAYRGRAQAVRVSYGSSGSFFAQISNGAPYDLYLSADVGYPRKLLETGIALQGSEFLYAIGRLVVWAPHATKLELDQLGMKALLATTVKRIAIANPAHAPYGKAAEAAMRFSGVYEAVQKKLVFGENAAQAAQFVETGNADLGLIPLSLALAPAMRDKGHFWEVPQDAFPRLEQGGVIVSASKQQPAARAFAQFLTSPDARAILARYGFKPPGK